MTAQPRRRISLERTYTAAIQDVWDLWTTKDGIESWWGPGGFRVTVHSLDLRAGGQMRYAMTAIDPPQVAFMQQHGMPLTTEARVTFTDVTPPTRLAYVHLVDFVPGVAPYDVNHTIELRAEGDTIRMVVTIDAMHDEEWTNRMVMGLEGELGKLDAIMAAAPRGRS